jgi:hypothetical protein
MKSSTEEDVFLISPARNYFSFPFSAVAVAVAAKSFDHTTKTTLGKS